jgi:hypothetical protein
LKGFAPVIGSCDALHAEVWGMYTWMQIARRQCFAHLILESYSKLLIDMITMSYKLNGKTSILIGIYLISLTYNGTWLLSTHGARKTDAQIELLFSIDLMN